MLKTDELDGSLREFYEWLKANKDDEQVFTQREVRQAYGISRTQMQRYINDLLELEYIEKRHVSKRNTHHYQISYRDDQAALKASIYGNLQEQLSKIK